MNGCFRTMLVGIRGATPSTLTNLPHTVLGTPLHTTGTIGDMYSEGEVQAAGLTPAMERPTIPYTQVLKIRKPDLPSVNYCFRFNSHATAGDAAGIAEQVRAADVVVPEAASWTKELLNTLRMLSSGIIEPNVFSPMWRTESDFTPYIMSLCEALHDSGAMVALADVPIARDADASEVDLIEEYEKLTKEYNRHMVMASHYANQLHLDEALAEYHLHIHTNQSIV